MKVKIIRRENPVEKSGSFLIYADDSLFKCVTFKTNVAENDVYHEETNRLEAMGWAARLEAVSSFDELSLETTIYETPINTEVKS